MAKAGKKRSEKTTPSRVVVEGPLSAAREAFGRGDYGRAKVLLREHVADASLSEGEREEAKELLAATGLERGTLWVGLACVGLLALVILVTKLIQP